MAADPFYNKCCISGDASTAKDPIEWHHNLIFAGRQVQAKFAILPLKRSLHRRAHNPQLAAQLNWVMLNRATAEDLTKYSKARNLHIELAALNCMFGDWTPGPVEAGILY